MFTCITSGPPVRGLSLASAFALGLALGLGLWPSWFPVLVSLLLTCDLPVARMLFSYCLHMVSLWFPCGPTAHYLHTQHSGFVHSRFVSRLITTSLWYALHYLGATLCVWLAPYHRPLGCHIPKDCQPKTDGRGRLGLYFSKDSVNPRRMVGGTPPAPYHLPWAVLF